MEAGQHTLPSAPPAISPSSTSSASILPQTSSSHHRYSPAPSNPTPPRRPHNHDDPAPSDLSIVNFGDHDALSDLKRPRACEACRQLKVRCDPDPDRTDGSCKRCSKAKRRCVVTMPTRKRQKKAESRVAELERKIDALTASLQASRAQQSGSSSNSMVEQQQQQQQFGSPLPLRQTPEKDEGMGQRFGSRNDSSSSSYHHQHHRQSVGSSTSFSSTPTGFGMKRHHTGEVKRTFVSSMFAPLSARQNSPSQDGPSMAHNAQQGGSSEGAWPSLYASLEPVPKPQVENEYRDVLDRGTVDVETATKSFDRYVNCLAPSCPFVVFPPGTTMGDIRRTKPVLFLTILSVSIGAFQPQLQMPLQNEVHRTFADRVLIRGEKSLELVQSLLVATLWYLPPEHFEELKFYQFIHIAAVMGVDIGMNRKTKPNSKTVGMWKEFFGNKTPLVDPGSLEARRAWLGCYFMAVNSSMSLRRPLLIRWQSYNDESCEMLRNSPDALPSDEALTYWVKLAHIAEDVGFRFSMADPTTSVNITEPQTQYALKGFERQLEDWRKEVPSEVYSPLLEHYEQILNVYMHEIGMHIDHNIDDFKPPFLGNIGEEGQADLGTAVHVDALTACLTSIHKSLQLFCSLDHRDLICLPTFHFVRTSYAAVALIKLFSLAISSGSRLNHIFDPADFKIEYFLDKLTHHLRVCGETKGGRIGGKFSLMVAMLKSWYMRSKDKQQPLMVPTFFHPKNSTTDSDSLKPLSLHTESATSTAPSPLHVLSEVATGRPSSTLKPEGERPVQPQQNEAEDSPMSMHRKLNAAPTRQAVPAERPIVSAPIPLMTPYIAQQMGLSTPPPLHPALTANYQPALIQQQFAHGPQSMHSNSAEQQQQQQQQQDLWSQGYLPEADLNLALTFQGNVWDDDFFPFSFDWRDRSF